MRFRMPAPLVCVLALLVLAIRPAHPQTLMENSRIAFVTDRDGNDEIYLMRVDGSELVNLTNDASADVDPAWSPEGDKIAFASDRDGDFEIYVMDRDGSDVTQVTYGAATDLHPSWSPDGERMLFSSDSAGGNPTVYVMNADGTNQTQISHTASGGSEPTWSADIAQQAFARPVGGRQQVAGIIYEYRRSFVSAVRARPGTQRSPAWSPNGRDIIWEEQAPDGQYDLWVKPLGSTSLTQLTNGTEDDLDPSWAPDGQAIALRREGDIWLMGLADSEGTRITASVAATDRDPAWSPFIDLPPDPLENTRIAYVSWTLGGHRGIHIVNYDGADDHWIVRDAHNADWSPDGTQLVFATTYEPPMGGQLLNSDIWVVDADGSDFIRLTSDAAYGPDDTHPSWSPDGSQIAFVSNRDGNQELYIVRTDGTDMRRLTFTTDHEQSPVWSPDGRRIAVTRSNGHGVFLLNVVDGAVTRIPTIGSANNPAWSPDGKQIAIDGIAFYDVEPPHTQRWGGRGYRPTWSPDGRKIAGLSNRDDGSERLVYVMNLDGSRPRRMPERLPAHLHSSPTWSPFLGPGAARITILNPADGEVLPFNTKSVTFGVDIDLHTGGWRWRSNARFPTEGPIGGNVGDDSRQVTLGSLVPGKSYTIRTALVNDAGELLSPNATSTVTFTVAPVPLVEITTPEDDESFAAGIRDIPLSVDIQHHDAHWHWRVNEAFPDGGLAGGNHVDVGSSSTIPELRDGVTYTVHAALVDDEHNLLEPSISTSSTFTTGDPSYVAGAMLPRGLSLFALPLAAERIRFFGTSLEGAKELDLTAREDGLTAFDLIAMGSTICVRMEQGIMQAAVGRGGVPLFGLNFPIDPARGYVVNMLEATALEIEGPPFGARLAAPAQDATAAENWAFVVAGNLGDSIHMPAGTRVRIRSGERVLTTPITASGAFVTAFVDSQADASV
ncbi:hypothetical protein HOK31_23370, partial [Candidatus Poribacteria bacterium]|nr:hypothetical protein [Candidatus Poribacteria bacterium]